MTATLPNPSRRDQLRARKNGAVQSVVRVALPSKGMEEQTLEFLANCGMKVSRPNPRQYRATIPALAGVEVLFQRATDVFAKVAEGSVDLGITGYDIVREHEREDDGVVMLEKALGYGSCALVLAVPEGWIDVSSVTDVAEITAEFRRRGRDLRVATKYPNLSRQFLFDNGINYYTIVESSGALEAAPALNAADVIVDLVSSGVTLRENRLKRVAGGTIVESQACLIGNRAALRDNPDKLEIARQVLELIEAQMRSRDYYSLTGNIRGDSPEAVARRVTSHTEVAGLRGPTISKVYPKLGGEEGWYAATVVVQSKLLVQAVDALRRAGAGDVSVAPLRYVFQAKCWSFERLCRQLNERSGDE
ncbi:MAG: ATP phosphoribosyltransferase [Chloroflexi bacterium]|nr:ATP phosphoribosyltransferase [Chloroflexota bacterium]